MMVESESTSKTTDRLISVDAFRGLTMVAMILVNNPGDWNAIYWPLEHAEWHGCTPTDLIFPFFLFIVGVAIVLALKRRVDSGVRKGLLVAKVIKRSWVLLALGLFLSGYPFGLFGPRTLAELLDTWRFPGVLQRIALCYLLASLLVLYCRLRTLKILVVVLLIGYWGLMTMVAVPGLGAPDIDDKGGHLAAWVDRAVFGDHVWAQAEVYDPEGLLSTLPALATTLLGVFAGLLLIARLDPLERATRLFVCGTVLVACGNVWSWFFPLNKSLWTSSYAVYTGGLAFCTLALCYWFFDLRGHERIAKVFVIYGVNAISVFVGSGILGRTLVYIQIDGVTLKQLFYDPVFASWLPPRAASLGYAVTWVLGWFLVLAWMHRRRLFIKI